MPSATDRSAMAPRVSRSTQARDALAGEDLHIDLTPSTQIRPAAEGLEFSMLLRGTGRWWTCDRVFDTPQEAIDYGAKLLAVGGPHEWSASLTRIRDRASGAVIAYAQPGSRDWSRGA